MLDKVEILTYTLIKVSLIVLNIYRSVGLVETERTCFIYRGIAFKIISVERIS